VLINLGDMISPGVAIDEGPVFGWEYLFWTSAVGVAVKSLYFSMGWMAGIWMDLNPLTEILLGCYDIKFWDPYVYEKALL